MNFSFKNLFLAIAVIGLTSCTNNTSSQASKSFWIDNPTDQSITVKIDKQTIEIPAESGQNIALTYGQHSLDYNNETINFVIIPSEQEMIINPTLSNYILFYQPTNDVEANGAILKYLYPMATEFGDSLRVPFKIVNPLFLEKSELMWDSGPDDADTVVENKPTQSSTVLISLHREKQFKTKESILASLNFQKQYNSFKDLKPVNSSSLFGDLSSDCESVNKLIALRKTKLDSLIISDSRNMLHLLSAIKGAEGSGTEINDKLQNECASKDDTVSVSNYKKTISDLEKKTQDIIGERNALIVQ